MPLICFIFQPPFCPPDDTVQDSYLPLLPRRWSKDLRLYFELLLELCLQPLQTLIRARGCEIIAMDCQRQSLLLV